jgi:VIT1/CCC1 family predicted Fe2+/Mn2+ transporter
MLRRHEQEDGIVTTPTATMADSAQDGRQRVLDPVDRVSELLFGLFMALTFVGAVSVAEAGRAQLRDMYAAALGCNLAWGLVDAVMHLVRTITARGRSLTLVRGVRVAPDAAVARALIRESFTPVVASLVTDPALDAICEEMRAMTDVPLRPTLQWADFQGALAIFLIVVASTFPVVLPFALIQDVGTAKLVSRLIALAMLFGGGLVLGRFAGYGSWKVGLMMAGLGTAVVAAVMALGG